MPQDPADAYRRARQHLAGTSLLTVTEQQAIREVFAYTDALETALAVVKQQVTNSAQAPDLGRLLAVLALQHDDHILRIDKVGILALAEQNIQVDIADTDAEVTIHVTIDPAGPHITH